MVIAIRTVVFLIVFAVLQVAWQLHAAQQLRYRVVHATVVVPAAGIAEALTPQLRVRAVGARMLGAAGSRSRDLNIVNGCDGTDMLFLLLAAFAAAPLPWGMRLAGALIGVGIVYVLNQLRVLALFYALGTNGTLFDLLHGYVAPVIMVVVIAGYFHRYIHRAAHPSVAAR